MTIRFFFLLSLCAFASNVWAFDENDPNWKLVSSDVKELCLKLDNAQVPQKDRPSPEQAAALKDCDSDSYYYGFSVPPDYLKARHCALAEGDDDVLTMIYANGKGVSQDLDLAIHFACKMGGAPAEIVGRINHLREMKNSKTPGNFDYCDDITSGFMMGVCQEKGERFQQSEREGKLATLIAKWTEEERKAFQPLQKAAQEFAKARSSHEVDLSGTARAAFIGQEQAIQERDFLESLQKLEAGKAPVYKPSQLKSEDQKLNFLYRDLMSRKEGEFGFGWGTVDPEGIKLTQKAWLKYRDAWSEFVKKKYPKSKYTSESVMVWFTKKRNHMLRGFVRSQ